MKKADNFSLDSFTLSLMSWSRRWRSIFDELDSPILEEDEDELEEKEDKKKPHEPQIW